MSRQRGVGRVMAGVVVGVLALGGAARAQDPVVGSWKGRPVTLGVVGSVWRGESGHDGAPYRLTLRRVDGDWQLVAERRVRVAPSPGLVRAVEGDRPALAPRFGWGDGRVVPLTRQGERLVGHEVELTLPAATPGPTPTPYDTGWFTDADALRTDGGERRYLDAALGSESDDDVRGLRPIDVNLASPEEKARLIEHLLDGDTTDDDKAWIADLFERLRLAERPDALGIRRAPSGEGARVLEALRRHGRLEHLASDSNVDVLRALPHHVRNADMAAALVEALAAGGSDERVLGAHWVLDRARAEGALDEVLARLRAAPQTDGLRRVLAAARPTRRAVIFGHRGDPLDAPENTVPALEAALARGATGAEIDLCLTRDGHIVLWHDQDPDGTVALARQLGLEGGVTWSPSVPSLGSSLRQELFRLTLAEVRASHGYSPAFPGASIPTLEEAAPTLCRFERVILDVKVPARPGLLAMFARAARRTLEAHGLMGKVVLMSPDAEVVRGLKRALPECAFTHDVEITRVLDGGDHSAVRAALALGNRVASIGRPVVPKLGGQFSYYLEVLTRDRARIEREGLDVELLAWTIDDELELREVLAVGVDGVLTNQVELAVEVMRRLGLAR